MPQVSKFRLRPDVWERIFDLYIDTIAGITEKEKLSKFIDNFFTPTEKIMFAKRLAACVMLAKNQDYRTIERVLRISPMTISRMSFHLKYEGEGLNPVIENILKKDAVKVLWEELKDLLDVPTKGKDWSELAKRKSVRKKKIENLKSI